MSLSRERLRWRCHLVALAAFALVLLGTAAPAEASGFCDTQVVRDYTKALKRLPSVPAPPGRLNFGPARVFLGRAGIGPLQLGPAERGFNLSYAPYEAEATRPTGRLGWHVTARLVKFDRRGRRLGQPQEVERLVKRLWPVNDNHHGLGFTFDVPGKPALYRLELVFENGRGERLARFGERFRVLRPSLDVDFFLNRATFRRGETVRAWLVNRGAAFLNFGLGQTIEYFDGAAWTSPPVWTSSGPIPAIGLSAFPGTKTSCWSTRIPADAVPGTYRFAKTVDYATSAPFGRGTPLDLGAEFTVTE
jgi:hypothetical protein